jgi:GT2 family glycosyltransferase
MKKVPPVSIIIVNFNGKKFLDKCLDSLSKINYHNYEIIVVDNHSTDESVNFVKENYPNVKIIELEENHGFTYPNNFASTYAKGDYLFFLNNDTEVTPTFLDGLIEFMENNNQIGICQSLLLTMDGKIDSSGDFIDSYGVPFSSHEKVSNPKKILAAKGAALIIRKNLFYQLGKFDEKFVISFEDVDLGWRCWIYGFEVWLVPTSIVYHHGGGTIKKNEIDIDFHGAKNHLIMKLTNFEEGSVFIKLFSFIFLYGLQTMRVWLQFKTKGKTTIHSTRYEQKLARKPKFLSILNSFIWIIRNQTYLKQRARIIKKNRVKYTKDLENEYLIFS